MEFSESHSHRRRFHFTQKFREINAFVTELCKCRLFSRNIYYVKRNFSFCHAVTNFFSSHRCNHDVRNKLGTRLEKVEKIPFKGLLKKMGNKLSCSCGPLKIKGYRYDASKEPWGQMMPNATTDERHIIR